MSVKVPSAGLYYSIYLSREKSSVRTKIIEAIYTKSRENYLPEGRVGDGEMGRVGEFLFLSSPFFLVSVIKSLA